MDAPLRQKICRCCNRLFAICASCDRGHQDVTALVFLTRDGCPATETMRARLDGALRTLGRSTVYPLIDVDTLPETDPRGGCGTPTVLVGDRDLFGMPEPATPHPPAT